MSREDDLDACFAAVRKAKYKPATRVFLLKSYVRQRPGHGEAWWLLGRALMALERRKEAESALKKAMRFAEDLNLARVHFELAFLYDGMGRFEEAKCEFALASMNDKIASWGSFWVLRGSTSWQLEDFEEAEKFFRRATECKEEVDLDEAFEKLGYLLQAQGRYSEASTAFRSAEKAAPERSEFREALRDLATLKKLGGWSTGGR